MSDLILFPKEKKKDFETGFGCSNDLVVHRKLAVRYNLVRYNSTEGCFSRWEVRAKIRPLPKFNHYDEMSDLFMVMVVVGEGHHR